MYYDGDWHWQKGRHHICVLKWSLRNGRKYYVLRAESPQTGGGFYHDWNVKCPLEAHIFQLLIRSWQHCLGRLRIFLGMEPCQMERVTGGLEVFRHCPLSAVSLLPACGHNGKPPTSAHPRFPWFCCHAFPCHVGLQALELSTQTNVSFLTFLLAGITSQQGRK